MTRCRSPSTAPTVVERSLASTFSARLPRVGHRAEAGDRHGCRVVDEEVVAHRVERDVDAQRLAGELGLAQLRDESLRLVEVLAGAVEVGEPSHEQRRRGAYGEGGRDLLRAQLGPAVRRDRCRLGVLGERRRRMPRRTPRRRRRRGRTRCRPGPAGAPTGSGSPPARRPRRRAPPGCCRRRLRRRTSTPPSHRRQLLGRAQQRLDRRVRVVPRHVGGAELAALRGQATAHRAAEQPGGADHPGRPLAGARSARGRRRPRGPSAGSWVIR